jgi:hypothetical protein
MATASATEPFDDALVQTIVGFPPGQRKVSA